MASSAREIFFVTGNVGKFKEAKQVVRSPRVKLIRSDLDIDEPQADNLEYVSRKCSMEALEVLEAPVLIEDSGLFVNSLGGFPGPYSSYAFRKIGCEGILRLLRNERDRRAYFKCVVAFASPAHKNPAVFVGFAHGDISKELRGVGGFGFDPIFVPRGNSTTFAQMSVEDKTSMSHRGKAFRSFWRWFVGYTGL